MLNPSEEEGVKEDFIEYEDEQEEPRVTPETQNPVDSVGKWLGQQPYYDNVMNAEVAS